MDKEDLEEFLACLTNARSLGHHKAKAPTYNEL